MHSNWFHAAPRSQRSVLRAYASARSGSELHFQEASRAAQMRKSSLPHCPIPFRKLSQGSRMNCGMLWNARAKGSACGSSRPTQCATDSLGRAEGG